MILVRCCIIILLANTAFAWPQEWKQYADGATSSIQTRKLLIAIARVETGNGASWRYKELRNAFGIKENGKYKRFASVKDSFTSAAAKLDTDARYKGKSVEEIGKIWCPPNHEDWAYMVNACLREEKTQ